MSIKDEIVAAKAAHAARLRKLEERERRERQRVDAEMLVILREKHRTEAERIESEARARLAARTDARRSSRQPPPPAVTSINDRLAGAGGDDGYAAQSA